MRRRIAALALWWTMGVAGAQGLGVAPIRLDLAVGERATVLQVSNTADEAVEVQVRAMAWSQADDADRYAGSDEIIVSPPRLTIPAHDQRVVRFYLADEAPRAHERAFRVHVDQLPKTSADGPSAVQLPLRLLVPFFVAGSAPTPPAMTWTVRPEGEQLRLVVRNDGGTHVRISALALGDDAASPTSVLLYALAGAERSLVVPRPAGWPTTASEVAIRVDSDAGAWRGRATILAPR